MFLFYFLHTLAKYVLKSINVVYRLGSFVQSVNEIRWISENVPAYPAPGRGISSCFQWK